MVAEEEVEVEVAEASIHHLLQAMETVPLWFAPLVVLVVLVRKEVEEVVEQVAQTDPAEVPEQVKIPERERQLGTLPEQAVVVAMVLSIAKRDKGIDHPIHVSPRWILALRFIMAGLCRHFNLI